MPKFDIRFTGRTRGALGVFSTFEVEDIEAETFEAAVLSLYERYEHVLGPRPGENKTQRGDHHD